MTVKSDDNTQFGRVANFDGTTPIAAAAANDGLAPLCDSEGRLITVPFVGGSILSSSPLRTDSGAAVLWNMIVSAPATLFQAFGSQASGGLLWAMLFDAAAGPPVGIPFVAALPVQNNGMWNYSFNRGLSFANGILVAYSTSNLAYAAPAAGGWITGLYTT